MFNLILRYYHTAKYLKWIQFKYRLIYLLKNQISFFDTATFNSKYTYSKNNLKLKESISSRTLWQRKETFSFLNIEHEFKNGINWNLAEYGKLWTYNLNYFEFLHQTNISKEEGLTLIYDFIQKEDIIKDGMDSFPISLRVIFWIKFLINHRIEDELIDQSLQRQLQKLKSNLEFHLLGNHLLENSFSLLFGAIYFDDEILLEKAKQILYPQLEEQILLDGAHFELSPMYHQLMLFRILDCINLLQNNPSNLTGRLLFIFHKKAGLMLSWLHQITWSNGTIPLLNDSTIDIAPMTFELQSYAEQLGVQSVKKKLKKVVIGNFQMKFMKQ